MAILHHQEILTLQQATVACGLAECRSVLLQGLSPQIVTSLPAVSQPAQQVLVDLSVLNDMATLPDGSCPLSIWLHTALALVPVQHDPGPFSAMLIALHERGHGLQDAPDPDETPIVLADVIYGNWVVELRTRSRRRPLLHLSFEAHGRLSTRLNGRPIEDPPGVGTWQILNANELLLRLFGSVTNSFSVSVRFITVSRRYMHGRSRNGETLIFLRKDPLGGT